MQPVQLRGGPADGMVAEPGWFHEDIQRYKVSVQPLVRFGKLVKLKPDSVVRARQLPEIITCLYYPSGEYDRPADV